MSAVRASGPSPNLKIVPINPCSRSGPATSLSFSQTFCILMRHCKHVLLCQACSCLVLDGGANTIVSRRCLSLWTRPISLRILFLHLYLLIADPNTSGLGPFEIFAPVSKADQGLSFSCLVGLALVHSTAFPLRTARL